MRLYFFSSSSLASLIKFGCLDDKESGSIIIMTIMTIKHGNNENNNLSTSSVLTNGKMNSSFKDFSIKP